MTSGPRELELFGAVFGAALLGGCVHIERYPQSWQPVQVGAVTDCAAVAATYTNEGQNAYGVHVSLATWLDPDRYKSIARAEKAAYQSDLTKAQTVQLRLTANVLTFVASGKDIHREWSFDSNKHEFECTQGVVRLHRFEVVSDLFLLVSKGSDYLYRVGDHLVVKSRDAGVGLVLFVPFAGGATSWARFSVIPTPSAGHGSGADGVP